MALTLTEIAVLADTGGPLLSRFAAAVRRVVSQIEAEPDITLNHAQRLAWAKAVFKERKYNYYALYCMDLAAVDVTSSLWAKGDQVTDAEIEQIVQTCLPRVVKLTQ